MTTTDPYPDAPLPAGAYVMADWHECDGDFRIISTHIKEVEGTNVGVSVDAHQLPDGALLDHAELKAQIRVDQRSARQWQWTHGLEFTPAGARQLARALMAAAEQLEEWAR